MLVNYQGEETSPPPDFLAELVARASKRYSTPAINIEGSDENIQVGGWLGRSHRSKTSFIFEDETHTKALSALSYTHGGVRGPVGWDRGTPPGLPLRSLSQHLLSQKHKLACFRVDCTYV